VDSSVNNLSELVQRGLPDDARTWLGVLGFRVTLDIHGEVVGIASPTEAPENSRVTRR